MRKDSDNDLVRDLLMEDEATMINSLGRWLPGVVVVSVLAGFIGLAWYAYHTGTQSLNEEDLPVIEADPTPLKEKPADPGGIKFSNQDKTVFETFAGNGEAPPKVEKLLPPPEEPMARNLDSSGTQTWVNDKLRANAGQEPAAAGEAVPSAPAPADIPIEEKPVVQEKAPPPVSAQPAASPAPQKSAPVAAGGTKVQLGAYRSNKEAMSAWKKIQQKYPELSDKSPLVVRADLGAKGVYHRLRVGGFSADDAKTLCTALSSRGQACMVVKE